MKNRILSIILAVTILVGVSVPVSAKQPETSYVYTCIEGQPTPRYTYTSMVIASISLDGQLATCSAGVEVYNDRNFSYVMSIQQSANGYSWKTLKSWSGTGTGIGAMGKQYYCTKGYHYRVVVTSTVNAEGNIENVTAESPSEYC